MSIPFYDPATWEARPDIDRALADKQIDGDDAETVKAFAEFLTKGAPAFKANDDGTRGGTREQQAWRWRALHDNQWREFMGLPPLLGPERPPVQPEGPCPICGYIGSHGTNCPRLVQPEGSHQHNVPSCKDAPAPQVEQLAPGLQWHSQASTLPVQPEGDSNE